MARILTGIQTGANFDLVNLDLNEIYSSRTGVATVLNDPFTVRGIVYTSSLRIDFPGANSPMYLYGDGFSFDLAGNLITGTVTALAFGPDQFDPNLIIQQFVVPAAEFDAAMRSANTADDQAIMATILGGADIIRMNDFTYVMRGYAGNDTIDAGRGDDLLYGDEGDDSLSGFFGDDTIYGGSGNDTIRGSAGDNLLYGGTGNDEIGTFNGNSTVEGGEGNDRISIGGGYLLAYGGDGDDTLVGARANDNLDGGNGNDLIYGSYGSDWITPGAGNNVIYGGDQADMVSYVDSTSRVVVDLTAGRASHHGTGVDQLFEVENVTGSIYGDLITGDAGSNRIRGLGDYDWMVGSRGSDTFEGGTGRDTVAYSSYATGVNANLMTGVGYKAVFHVDTFIGVENLTGSSFNDTLTGDNDRNILRGLAGDDFIYGNAGNDTIDGGAGRDWIDGSANNDRITGGRGNDTIIGGQGWDTAIYSGARSEYSVVRNADGSVSITHLASAGGVDGSDIVSGVEVLEFTDGRLFL